MWVYGDLKRLSEVRAGPMDHSSSEPESLSVTFLGRSDFSFLVSIKDFICFGVKRTGSFNS